MTIANGRYITWTLIVLFLLSLAAAVYSIASYTGGNSAPGGLGGLRQGGWPGPGGDRERPAFDGGRIAPGAGETGGADKADASSANSGGTNASGSDGGDSAGDAGRGMGDPGRAYSDAGDPGGRGFGGAVPTPYAAPLAGYAVVFFAAAGAGILLCRRKPAIRGADPAVLAALLLGIGLLLRIAAAPWIPGNAFDTGLFKSWAASAAADLAGFYRTGPSDYPPLYIYVLFAVGKLAAAPGFGAYADLLIKLPSILADGVTAWLLFRTARRTFSPKTGLAIAAFYLFNPAIFINSTFWGQVDSFFTMLAVGALLFLTERKWAQASALLAAAVLMKPQGIIYLPVLAFALLSARRLKPWLAAAGAALLTVIAAALPFSSGLGPNWLYELYTGTINEYPYASVNAFNFFALLKANYTPDTTTLFLFSYHTWGMLFIAATTLFAWGMYARSRTPRFAAAAALMQIAGVFTFASSMHERYLFPAAALSLLAFLQLRDRRYLWLAAAFSVSIFWNTYEIFYHTGMGQAEYGGPLIAVSVLNVLLCGCLGWVMWSRREVPDDAVPPGSDIV